jgi:hypothetical protein
VKQAAVLAEIVNNAVQLPALRGLIKYACCQNMPVYTRKGKTSWDDITEYLTWTILTTLKKMLAIF